MKLDVSDAHADAVFVVFDGDMQNLIDVPCSTLVSLSKVLLFVHPFISVM